MIFEAETGDFDDATEAEKFLAMAIAHFDYFDKPIDRKSYPVACKYVNEWWREQYVPVVRALRRVRDDEKPSSV